MWEEHESFPASLAESWQQEREAVTAKDLQLKLKGVANHLGRWERQTFGHVRRELKRLKEDLERMQSTLTGWGHHQRDRAGAASLRPQ